MRRATALLVKFCALSGLVCTLSSCGGGSGTGLGHDTGLSRAWNEYVESATVDGPRTAVPASGPAIEPDLVLNADGTGTWRGLPSGAVGVRHVGGSAVLPSSSSWPGFAITWEQTGNTVTVRGEEPVALVQEEETFVVDGQDLRGHDEGGNYYWMHQVDLAEARRPGVWIHGITGSGGDDPELSVDYHFSGTSPVWLHDSVMLRQDIASYRWDNGEASAYLQYAGSKITITLTYVQGGVHTVVLDLHRDDLGRLTSCAATMDTTTYQLDGLWPNGGWAP